MNEDAGTTIINERHDYTGAALAICLALVAIGYFLFNRPTAKQPRPRTAQADSPSVALDAYELERSRLVQLQSEILQLRKRYDMLDPRMVKLRNELATEMRAKFKVYKVEYEGSYLPLKTQASELYRERG